MSQDCKAQKEDYAWQARSQYKGAPRATSLKVEANIYFGTKRRVDVDNFSKLILDACTGILWLDDSQIMTMTVSKHYDKSNPRIELETIEL